jgi:hypothetical protein
MEDNRGPECQRLTEQPPRSLVVLDSTPAKEMRIGPLLFYTFRFSGGLGLTFAASTEILFSFSAFLPRCLYLFHRACAWVSGASAKASNSRIIVEMPILWVPYPIGDM